MPDETEALVSEIHRLRGLDLIRKRIAQNAEQNVRDLKYVVGKVSKDLKDELENLHQACDAHAETSVVDRIRARCQKLVQQLSEEVGIEYSSAKGFSQPSPHL